MDGLRNKYANILSTRVSFLTVVSEVVGVFSFVLLGCGAWALCNAPVTFPPEAPRMVKELIIGFAFGSGITFSIYATAHNDSGQLNPAVTLALVASGIVPLAQAALNICGQILGALIAAGVLKGLLPDNIDSVSPMGANKIPENQTAGRAFLAETVGTFVAVWVVLEAVCNPRTKAGNIAPVAIGLAFAALLTILSPFSSGSFNPARTLGPAAVTGQSADLWIWIFGPLVGAAVAVPFHLASVGLYGHSFGKHVNSDAKSGKLPTAGERDKARVRDSAQGDLEGTAAA